MASSSIGNLQEGMQPVGGLPLRLPGAAGVPAGALRGAARAVRPVRHVVAGPGQGAAGAARAGERLPARLPHSIRWTPAMSRIRTRSISATVRSMLKPAGSGGRVPLLVRLAVRVVLRVRVRHAGPFAGAAGGLRGGAGEAVARAGLPGQGGRRELRPCDLDCGLRDARLRHLRAGARRQAQAQLLRRAVRQARASSPSSPARCWRTPCSCGGGDKAQARKGLEEILNYAKESPRGVHIEEAHGQDLRGAVAVGHAHHRRGAGAADGHLSGSPLRGEDRRTTSPTRGARTAPGAPPRRRPSA